MIRFVVGVLHVCVGVGCVCGVGVVCGLLCLVCLVCVVVVVSVSLFGARLSVGKVSGWCCLRLACLWFAVIVLLLVSLSVRSVASGV